MPRPIMLLTALALWLPAAGHACTQAQTGGVLSPVTTRRVALGPAITGSANFSFSCSGVLASLASGTPKLEGRIQSQTTNLKLKNPDSDVDIAYEVFADPAMSVGYAGGGVIVSLAGATLLGLLNGGTAAQVPLYIRTQPGPNIKAGTYTDTVTLTWSPRHICEGVAEIGNVCIGTPNYVDVTAVMLISLTVSNDCTITAPPVNFGSAPLLAGFPTVAQSIALQCSLGMVYTVGLSKGSAVAGNGQRQMSAGTSRLAYDLFKSDGTVWGNVGAARANGPAAGTGTTVQSIPYEARISQTQSAPTAGVYSDNLTVDVSF